MGQSFHLPGEGQGQILRQLFPKKIPTKMFLEHKVGELLFDTYHIEFIDELNTLIKQLGQQPINLTDFAFFMDVSSHM